MFDGLIRRMKQILGDGESQARNEADSIEVTVSQGDVAGFRRSLVAALREPPPEGVWVDEIAGTFGIDPSTASDICEELYLSFSRKVVADAVITPAERGKLDGLAATLGIGSTVAHEIEKIASKEVYQSALADAKADGIITPEEYRQLDSIRRALGLVDQVDSQPRIGTVAPAIHAAHLSPRVMPAMTPERPVNRDQFRRNLVRDINRFDPKTFDLAAYAADSRVPMPIASEVADQIYSDHVAKVVADGVISDGERAQLQDIARALRISTTWADWAEQRAKEVIYRKAVVDVLADGVISPSEAVRLESLRRSLSIKAADAASISASIAGDAYESLIRRVVDRGEVDDASLMEVERFKRALLLSNVNAMSMLKGRAATIYREAVAAALQDGVVEPKEEALLEWLKFETGLDESQVSEATAKIREAQRLAALRGGQIPAITSRRLLEGGEFCHWDGDCRFIHQAKRGPVDSAGELIVTSKRVMFVSPTRSFTFAPWKIIDIDVDGNRITVKTEVQKGNGIYVVEPFRELEAILIGLARKGKFTAADGFSSEKSRHIPGDVRRAVWERDGGRCVRCKDNQYLEYDHIIPHSLGGANTFANVQLLCRKCNNAKSDRI